MQAVRPRQRDYERIEEPVYHETGSPELAPPPAPFPIELLRSSDQVQVDLDSVQTACVAALSSLLPETTSQITSLSDRDTRLASTLTELLEVCYEIEELDTAAQGAANGQDGFNEAGDTWSELARVLTETRASRATSITSGRAGDRLHNGGMVRAKIAWTRWDYLSQIILRLVEERISDRILDDQNGDALRNGFHRDVEDDQESLPPRYSLDEHHNHPDQSSLPHYDDHTTHSQPILDHKSFLPASIRSQPESYGDEKMLHELDSVTSAIERLQHVAPQLHAQRVEAGPSRLRDVAQARARMERDKMRELEEIWAKIERAHMKRGVRERVDLEGYEERRAVRREAFLRELLEQSEARRLQDQDSAKGNTNGEYARARDLRDREHFMHELAKQSSSSRLNNQDAEASVDANGKASKARREKFISNLVERSQAGRLNGQDYASLNRDTAAIERKTLSKRLGDRTLLDDMDDSDSLPPTPRVGSRIAILDPNELVTVGDFFRDQPHPDYTKGPSSGSRSRSASGSETGEVKKGSSAFGKLAGLVRRRSGGMSSKAASNIDLSAFSYIAEHQENLRSVVISVHGDGLPLDKEWRLECGTMSRNDSAGVTDATITLINNATTFQISLPTPVHPSQTVYLSPVEGHLEGKITALPTTPEMPSLIPTQPLSATELRHLAPRALCCSNCDREVADLAQASEDEQGGYKDLPSEYWAEMMEVWMCHADPTWTAKITERSKEGFWPLRGKVLVGGSYVLLHPKDVKLHNLLIEQVVSDNDWCVVKCPCGEVLGKQRSDNGESGGGVFRFAKWSIGLVREDEAGERVESVLVPLSVFVVADMLELAQAHATHRFIITDEATGEDTILIWLFNPSVRISFRKSSQLAASRPPQPNGRRSSNPKYRRSSSGNALQAVPGEAVEPKDIRVAKVMYKVLNASEALDALPSFGDKAQAERLLYPRDVCARLAAALQDSTAVHPVSRRKMGGFHVGFLERA